MKHNKKFSSLCKSTSSHIASKK